MCLRFLDEYEELEQLEASSYGNSQGYSRSPAHVISTLHEYSSLSIIMSRILTTLYTEVSTRKDPAILLEASKSLQQELQIWYEGLQPKFALQLADKDGSTALPHILALL